MGSIAPIGLVRQVHVAFTRQPVDEIVIFRNLGIGLGVTLHHQTLELHNPFQNSSPRRGARAFKETAPLAHSASSPAFAGHQ